MDMIGVQNPGDEFMGWRSPYLVLVVCILKVLVPVPRKFLGIVGQDPSDSKSSRIHVDIIWFCFIHLRYIL